MPGGLLNIIAYGNQNIILNGDPSKTFFKNTYAKYTNFGLQKYRLDYNGQRNIQPNESSKFTFKIPRYGELLLNSYLVIQLPNIWSPIYNNTGSYNPYNFKWIKHIGTMIIEEVVLSCGGQILQQFSGDYIKNRVERNDLNTDHFYKMTGNEKSLYEPENAYNRNGYYPNCIYNEDPPEPSINGRKLYIPLPFWFSNSSKCAFPLVSLQYSELQIDITLKPMRELFTTLDVETDLDPNRLRPNFGSALYQMYNFLQVPTENGIYELQTNTWASDIHLINTYAFLSEEESRVFAANEQTYLFLDIKKTIYTQITGTKRIDIETNNLVSNWFWYLRRNDQYERNEWSNYTNWKFENVPNIDLSFVTLSHNDTTEDYSITQFPTENNSENILQKVSILVDGKFRENEFDADVYRYIEKYEYTNGNSSDGLYMYSFSLDTHPKKLQPCGAMNLGRFKDVTMDILTITPDLDDTQTNNVICDEDGNIIGYIDTDPTKIYKYAFDFVLFEERYNVIRIMGGNASILYAR